MEPKIWDKCFNDEFVILSYNSQFEDETVQLLKESFFINEVVSAATGVGSCEESQNELAKLCIEVAKNGVTLIAQEVKSSKIVGVSFNVIQSPPPADEPTFFENFRDFECKAESCLAFMNYMIMMDSKVDVFKKFDVDCLLEIMFLAVHPNYGKRGLGVKLVECAINMAKDLKDEKLPNTDFLPDYLKDKKPKLVSAVFTSKYSQSVGKKMGFQDLAEVPYTEFKFKNDIGDLHPSMILVARPI